MNWKRIASISCGIWIGASAFGADEDIEALKRHAQLGDPESQWKLGLNYVLGKGVSKDMTKRGIGSRNPLSKSLEKPTTP